jgi:hypothetical protein
MPATAPSNETFAQAVAHFNAEAYRDALLAFEQCWFSERNDFLRGLLQLSNALNQLRLGLITGPRRTLASAARLLAPYEPQHTGLDMAAVCAYIAELRACIPARHISASRGNNGYSSADQRTHLLYSRRK